MWYTTAPRFKHPSNWTFVGKLLCLCLSPSLCTPRMVHMGFIRPLCSLGLCSSFSRLGGSETVSLTKYFSYCARSALRSEQKLLCSLSSGCAPICVFLSDFVTVTLSLRFGNVTVTARDFTFYDCTAVKQLSGSQPWVIADDLSAVLSVCLLLICAVHADPLIESHSPSESVLFCLVPGSLFVPPSVHLAPFVIISVSVFPPTHCPLFNSPVQACDPGF